MLVGIETLSKELGVHQTTLRRWEREGKITPIRTSGNHRRYDLDQVLFSVKNKNKTPAEKCSIGYARVSTPNKKDDLDRQKQVIELYCSSHGWNYKIIEDIGSGLNYAKKGFNTLIDLIEKNEVNRIIITHKDRLLRFGMEMFTRLCQIHNVEMVIINQDDAKPDYQKELVDDVLSVITVFSARLYGSRSHKNKNIVDNNKKMFAA